MAKGLYITDREKEVVRKHFVRDGVKKCAEILGCTERRAYSAWVAVKRDMARAGAAVPRRDQRHGEHLRAEVCRLYPQLGLSGTQKALRLGERVVLRIAREEGLVGKGRPGPKAGQHRGRGTAADCAEAHVHAPSDVRSEDPAVNRFWEVWDARRRA